MREALGSDADPRERRAFDAEFSRYLSMAARSRQRIRRLGARVLGTAPALASGDEPR